MDRLREALDTSVIALKKSMDEALRIRTAAARAVVEGAEPDYEAATKLWWRGRSAPVTAEEHVRQIVDAAIGGRRLVDPGGLE